MIRITAAALIAAATVSQLSSAAGLCSFISSESKDWALRCHQQQDSAERAWTWLEVDYPTQSKYVHLYSESNGFDNHFGSVSCQESEGKTFIEAKRSESEPFTYHLTVEKRSPTDPSLVGKMLVQEKDGIEIYRELDCSTD